METQKELEAFLDGCSMLKCEYCQKIQPVLNIFKNKKGRLMCVTCFMEKPNKEGL